MGPHWNGLPNLHPRGVQKLLHSRRIWVKLIGICSRSLDQHPMPPFYLDRGEGVEVEAEMVRGRHVDHPAGTDEALRALDLVAQFCPVEASSAPGRLDEDHQPVIGVAAEG